MIELKLIDEIDLFLLLFSLLASLDMSRLRSESTQIQKILNIVARSVSIGKGRYTQNVTFR